MLYELLIVAAILFCIQLAAGTVNEIYKTKVMHNNLKILDERNKHLEKNNAILKEQNKMLRECFFAEVCCGEDVTEDR